ncbi:MAG: HD domain-containing protein [Roseburia sp.]|nr:HD domain-containing protein [Anaeroplasma bactoclasticum]MCM1196289.1 HD domain-containing protein [Roseburia sp.]MCM1557460.1 HD domain-containing protein [Anaeroplasma bactoclasticum]
MFEKLSRIKVFRDPLYGYIEVEYKIILQLIDSKEVQRLRRIRQLSGVAMVFHTAEHSRFTHALGAYHIANLVLHHVEGIEVLSEYERVVFLCASLLHDIGHGPYSHAFENVLSTSHEAMTEKIILCPETDVYQILNQVPGLAEDVAGIIGHKGKFPLIESFVSSQLDVDRMDYLTRDAYFTGATYGTIDMHRLLRSMKVVDRKVLCRASGVHTLESYLMSRYHMYFQVYYHPVARAYELLLESIYERIKDLTKNGIQIDANLDSFLNVVQNNDDVASYIELDDAYVNGFIKQLAKSEDFVLRRLALAFNHRKLFKYIDLANEPDPKLIEEIKVKMKSNPNGKYFYFENSVSAVAYLQKDKQNTDDLIAIKVILPNGEIKNLDDYSPIVHSLVSSSYKRVERIYYFEDLLCQA